MSTKQLDLWNLQTFFRNAKKLLLWFFKYLLEFHVSKSNTQSTVLEASWVPPWEENLGKLCKYDVIYKIFLIFTVLLVITRGDKFGKICNFYFSYLCFGECLGLSLNIKQGKFELLVFFSWCWHCLQKQNMIFVTHWIKLFGAQVLVAILVQERVHHLMIGRMTSLLENTILVEWNWKVDFGYESMNQDKGRF